MKVLTFFVLMLTALNIPPLFGRDPQIPDSLKIIEKVYLHTDRVTYYPSEDIWFKAYLIDAYDMLLSDHSKNLHVELISPSSAIIESRVVKIDSGLAHGDFRLPANLKSGSYVLRAYTNYMRNFGDQLFFNRNISIINPADTLKPNRDSSPVDNRFEITFFPEGGSLVENVPSLVAFKAVDANGIGCDVRGEVISSSGGIVTSFKSSHRGMGSFYLTPSSGEGYFASVINRAGDTIDFRLPTPLNNGVVMNISKNNSRELLVTIRTSKKTLPAIINKTLTLEASARSILFKKASFSMSSQANSFSFPVEDLPDGIYTLTLKDEDKTPLCERLAYIQKTSDLKLKINTDKNSYEQRDSVSVHLSLSESRDTALKAYMSLSATDNMFTGNPSPVTISSWFLLQSDIKGNVEEPSYYFDPSNADRLKDLDNLLLTQGWRDFAWKHNQIEYPAEDGFILSGRVRKVLTDRPLKDAIVNIGIFKTGNPVIRVIASDSTGKFFLDGLNFSGKAKVIVSTIDRKDKLNGWVQVDSMLYKPALIPLTKTVNPKTTQLQSDQDSIKPEQKISRYIQYAEIKRSTSRKYRLSDTIRPGEVTIVARKVDAPESARARSRRYLMSTPDREIVITEMEEKYNNTFQFVDFRLLAPIATKMPSGAGHRLVNPLYMIDGVYATEDELKMLPVDWVERIDVATNEAALAPFKLVSIGMSFAPLPVKSANDMAKLGFGGSQRPAGGQIDGVISIITRNIYNSKAKPVFYTANVQISGYDEPRVFYSPKHHASLQSDFKPDQRITLLWKPDITINNNKTLVLNYYNADSPGKIMITVEGITSSGIPVTGTAEYEVK